jgi:hypothetical protein
LDDGWWWRWRLSDGRRVVAIQQNPAPLVHLPGDERDIVGGQVDEQIVFFQGHFIPVLTIHDGLPLLRFGVEPVPARRFFPDPAFYIVRSVSIFLLFFKVLPVTFLFDHFDGFIFPLFISSVVPFLFLLLGHQHVAPAIHLGFDELGVIAFQLQLQIALFQLEHVFAHGAAPSSRMPGLSGH